jgi:hypothetical protein
MTECREHHFDDSGRCSICSMQARYYCEAMATLHSWSQKEKEDPAEHWQETVDSYKCKLHTHEHESVVKGLCDSFRKLYDMEGN